MTESASGAAPSRPPPMRERRATLTEGPIPRHLVRLTMPMVLGLLAMMGFNLADTYFVAQLGPRELAAMSFTFPVVLFVTSLGIGLMAGTSSVLARCIGDGDEDRVRALASDALVLSLVIAIALAAIGIATLEPLFRALGADERTLGPIGEYMRLWYLGLVFLLPPMAAVGAIRATGDSAGQSSVLVAASVVNLILDPLLIFGLAGLPRMGIEGAALASVLARALSLVPGFYLLHVRHRLLDLRPRRVAEIARSFGSILHVAAPAAGTNAIIPVAMGVVTALVASHGPHAVAGFGVAFRIESLSLIVFYAMSAIIGPLVGQNLGARRVHRAEHAISASTSFCVGAGLAIAALLALAAPWLAALFSDLAGVRETAVQYLRWVPWSYGAAGVIMVVNAAFNGAGHPLAATGVSLARIVGLQLPLAWAGSALGGAAGIFAGLTAANIGGGIIASAWWRRSLPKLRHEAGT